MMSVAFAPHWEEQQGANGLNKDHDDFATALHPFLCVSLIYTRYALLFHFRCSLESVLLRCTEDANYPGCPCSTDQCSDHSSFRVGELPSSGWPQNSASFITGAAQCHWVPKVSLENPPLKAFCSILFSKILNSTVLCRACETPELPYVKSFCTLNLSFMEWFCMNMEVDQRRERENNVGREGQGKVRCPPTRSCGFPIMQVGLTWELGTK